MLIQTLIKSFRIIEMDLTEMSRSFDTPFYNPDVNETTESPDPGS